MRPCWCPSSSSGKNGERTPFCLLPVRGRRLKPFLVRNLRIHTHTWLCTCRMEVAASTFYTRVRVQRPSRSSNDEFLFGGGVG